MLFSLFLLAVLFVAQDLLRPKPRLENARPENLQFPTATRGRPVPLLWGTERIKAPNVLWYGDVSQDPITIRVKTSMIFNTGKRQIVGFKYYAGLQLGLCRGDASTRLRRFTIGEKEVWSGTLTDGQFVDINLPEFFGGDTNGNGGLVGRLRFHAGTATQAQNAYLQLHQTVGGVTPRYTGTSYVVWEGGYIGNSARIDAWAFDVDRLANPLGLTANGVVNGADMNPMNVAYELFSANTEWGFRYASTEIDLVNWKATGETLLAEGNGWSMLLEQTREGTDLLEEIQRQIDGIFYLDHPTGKWKIQLARGGYDPLLLPEIKAGTNQKELRNYSRGAWAETSNTVRVKFVSRTNEYTEDYAVAIDTANALMQGGGTLSTLTQVVAESFYPAVRNAALANSIAWRDLRTLSYPLAKATLAVSRDLWSLAPFSVVAWTDTTKGITRMPMRVQRIGYGELEQGFLVLDLVQDVFESRAGAFANPPGTGWTPPSDTLSAFPSTEQFAMEAPRGAVMRDEIPSLQPRVWCGGRRIGPASSFVIRERHSSGVPSGSFTDAGQGFGFTLIGQLSAVLGAGTAVPTTTITLNSTPSSQAALEAAFFDNPDLADQGRNLMNLILVENELMLVRSAATSGADVVLTDVYRGVLDTAQTRHAANTKVFLVLTGTAMTDTTFVETHNVDIKLLPKSTTNQVAEGSATTIAVVMDKRVRRPYPPASATTNGGSTVHPTTNSLDHLASGAPETTGMRLTILRRDYRLGNGFNDEIAGLLTDAETLDPSFPAANTTTHNTAVRNDPQGANTLLFTLTGATARDIDVLRLRILRHTDGVVPTRMRVEVSSVHNDGTDTGLLSRSPLTYDFDTTSAALAGKFNFGARTQSTASNTYTATVNGTYNFTLSSSFSTGDVEYQLNAGAWTQLIAAGGTTGNIAGVVATDTIKVRHQNATAGIMKQLDMDAPGAGQDAYFVAYNA